MNDTTRFGPKMAALTEKQRGYVLAMLASPFGNPTQWARTAGYSDVKEGAKVRAHGLAHDPRIAEAADEVARQHLGTMGPVLGLAVAIRIAKNPKHPKQLRAAEMLLNRVGLHEKTEHLVTVDHSVNAAGMVERIKAAAALLGVDAAALLGGNTPEPLKLIEGEVVDAGPAQP